MGGGLSMDGNCRVTGDNAGEAAPVRLTRIAADSVAILNALRRPRRPLTLSLDGHALTWYFAHEAKSAPPLPLALGLTLGTAPATLEASPEALAALTAHLGLQRPLAQGDAELRALWLEYALLEWLEPLEAQLGVAIHLLGDATQPADTLPIRLPLRLEAGGRTHDLRLCLATATAQRLLPAFDTHCPARLKAYSTVPLPLQWIVGHQDLILAELRRLVPGDVVMLERPARGMAAVIAGRIVADVAIHDGQLRLLCPPYALTHGDFNMAQTPSDADNAQGHGNGDPPSLDDATLDQLPVRLVCEVGRLELSLGELRKLDEGSLLTMSRPVEAAVDLVVNGRSMGRGRLVEIGDGLGVQIVRLASDE
ncbi:type III secretion protein Q [Modicisalibacter muralis]|uniref:Type III secretion protein Q n=2 Tax=Modicisalibacter muralis TaxID=119000 RepID=A0A1G9NJ43_9GAMM|nr:type III secretion protein Q [Halomonas muralis]